MRGYLCSLPGISLGEVIVQSVKCKTCKDWWPHTHTDYENEASERLPVLSV